jgi:hypothetical protein
VWTKGAVLRVHLTGLRRSPTVFIPVAVQSLVRKGAESHGEITSMMELGRPKGCNYLCSRLIQMFGWSMLAFYAGCKKLAGYI